MHIGENARVRVLFFDDYLEPLMHASYLKLRIVSPNVNPHSEVSPVGSFTGRECAIEETPGMSNANYTDSKQLYSHQDTVVVEKAAISILPDLTGIS
jgi:hypothetical protein